MSETDTATKTAAKTSTADAKPSKTTKATKAKTSKTTTRKTSDTKSQEKPSTASAGNLSQLSFGPRGSGSKSSSSSNSSRRGGSSKSSRGNYSSQKNDQSRPARPGQHTEESTGFLDFANNGHAVVRIDLSRQSEKDAYLSLSAVRKYKLRPGDVITGTIKEPKENDRYWGMTHVTSVNGMDPQEQAQTKRTKFRDLTPVYPDEQLNLEIGAEPLSLRIIDMIAPIGKGQRSLIVSPPKAGKTTLLKNIATALARNNKNMHIMAVLVGERPEEVTDIHRHIHRLTDGRGEVAASNFDESAKDQCRVAELALERAKRLVETGMDVVILLDSITRLARAYNLAIPSSGRTLSGGFDPQALFPPKKFFGAARNFEVPGSLTIVGTALTDTGSRMDDLIYEEFKGTGNQEIHLDRRLAERRIHPAIDVQRSGTRRDDLLIENTQYQSVLMVHRMLDMLDRDERTTTLIQQLKKTESNKDFLASLKQS